MRSTQLRQLFLAALLLGPLSAWAAPSNIIVDTTADVAADDGVCSLREAIENANTDTDNGRTSPGECAPGVGADVIVLPAGTITLGSALPDLSSDMTLSGTGSGSSIIDGDFTLTMNSGNVTLQDLTLAHTSGNTNDALVQNGGDLVLRRSKVLNGSSRGVVAGGNSITIVDSEVSGFLSSYAFQTFSNFSVDRSLFRNNDVGIDFESAGVISNSTITESITYGLYLFFGSAVTVDSCTISGNLGEGIRSYASPLTLNNSIVFGNGSVDVQRGIGTVTSTYNILGSISGFSMSGTDLSADPGLQPLANNGGFTHTYAILATSNAHDSGNTVQTKDQRGTSRPQGSTPDRGAFELVLPPPPAPAVTALNANSSAISGTSAVVTIGGTDFTGADAVFFNGVSSTSFTVVNSVTITAQVPANVAGNGNVIVHTALGFSATNASNAFTYASGPIVVTTTNDAPNATDGLCGLREAVAAANGNVPSGSVAGECGATLGSTDIVVLPAGTFTLGASLTVTESLTLSGSGMGSSVIDGNNSRQINATGAGITLTAQDLGFTQMGKSGFGPLNGLKGGANTLTLIRCDLHDWAGLYLIESGDHLNIIGSNIHDANAYGAKVNGTLFMDASSVYEVGLSGYYALDMTTIGSPTNVVLRNSTFSHNGLPIYMGSSNFNVSIDHCSIVDSVFFGLYHAGGTVSVKSSIAWNGLGSTTLLGGGGTYVNLGYNVLDQGSASSLGAGSTDRIEDPLLVALATNGGSTYSRALGAGSAALNAGPASDPVTVDQRGTARPQGAFSDAGAYEAVVSGDSTAPTFDSLSPAASSSVDTSVPLIGAVVSDAGFGVDRRSVVLLIDGVTVSAGVAATAGSIYFRPATPLSTGSHSAALFMKDMNGNSASQSWSFTVVGALARYHVGAGQEFGDLFSALAAVKEAETRLGGGAASYQFARFIDLHSGTYSLSTLTLDSTQVGGSPTVANPLTLRRASDSDQPLFNGFNSYDAMVKIQAPNVILDGLDMWRTISCGYPVVTVADVTGVKLTRNYVRSATQYSLLEVAGASADPVISGNGFYRTAGFSGSGGCGPCVNTVVETSVHHIQFSNNVVQSVAGGEYVHINANTPASSTVAANVFYDPTGSASGQNFLRVNDVPGVSDDNVFHSSAPVWNYLTNDNTASSYSLSAWNSAFSLDANSVQGDPQFVSGGSAGMTGYQLASSCSPAYGRAQSLHGLSSDYAGTARPQGTAGEAGPFESLLAPAVSGPSISTLVPASGSSVATSVPRFSAAFGGTCTVDPSQVVLMIDGVTVTSGVTVSSSSLSYRPATPLSQGSHSVAVFAKGFSGPQSSANWSFSTSTQEARYHVGAGQDFADLAAGLQAVNDAETALGGGSFHFPRYIDVHAGSYPTSLVIDAVSAGGTPTSANPLGIRRAVISEHPVLTQVLNQTILDIQTDHVLVDGFDLTGSNDGNATVRIAAVTGAEFKRNFVEVATGSPMLFINGAVDPVIAGNGFYRTGSGGGSSNTYALNLNVDRVQFSNNVIEDAIGGELVFINAATPSNVTIAANIFYDGAGIASPLLHVNAAPGFQDDNIFFSSPGLSGLDIHNDATGLDYSLANWQAAFPALDGNSVDADPQFTFGTGAHRYDVTSASAPGVERAQSTYGLVYDYFGKSRYPDVGFTEYVPSTTVKPILTVGFPAAGATNVTAGYITINAHIQDPGGSGIDVLSVAVTLDGVELARSTSATYLSAPTGVLSVGLHHVSVDVKDNAGNSANQLNWTFVAGTGLGGGDTTPPVISGASPIGVTTNADPIIYVSVTDTASGVSLTAVALRVDGSLVPATVTANATAAVITYTALSSFALGQHTVSLDVADAVGNTHSQYLWNFNVVAAETTPPVIGFNSPIGVTSNAAATIYASVTDTASGVNAGSIVVKVDGVAVVPTLGAPTAAGIDISYTAGSLSLGSHIVDISADDALGNHAVHLNWAFTVVSPDTTKPVFASDAFSPSPVGVTNTGTPTIFFSVTDTGSGMAGGVVKVDGVDVSSSLVSGGPTATGIDVSYTPTTALSLGSHIVSVDAFDMLGNAAQLTWAFTVVSPDTTAPVIGFNAPVGVTNTGTPKIYASVTDTAVGVDTATIVVKVDGAVVTPTLGAATAAGIDISYTPGVALAIGTHLVTIDAKDLLGNKATQLNWTLTVVDPDNTAPVISNGIPTGIVTVNDPELSAEITDSGSGVDPASIRMSLDGNPVTGVFDGLTASYSLTFSASTLPVGVHTVNVDAKDLNGNSAAQLSWSFTVVLDTVAPTASLVTPAGASVTHTTNVVIEALLADNAGGSGVNASSVSMTVDGVAVPAIYSAGSFKYIPALLPVGTHLVTVNFKDNAGNAASQLAWSFDARVEYCTSCGFDDTPPSISNVMPAGGSTTNTATPMVWAALTDFTPGSGVNPTAITVTVDGALVGYTVSPITVSYTTSAYGVTVLAGTLGDGIHTVTVDVKDFEGHAATQASWQFTVASDVTAPSLTITAPTTAAPLTVAAGATLNVSYTYTEAHPDYVRIQVKSGATVIGESVISSGLLAGAGVTRTDSVSLLSVAPAVTGNYDVVVTLVDTVALSTTKTNANAVTFDKTAPVAAGVESPTNGSTVTSVPGNATIAAYLSDAGAGNSGVDPASFKLLLDGAYVSPLVSAATGTGYTVSYTATAMAAGNHTMTLSYADKVGNAGVDKSWSFTMVRDNTAPVVSTISVPTTAAPLTVAAGATINVSYAYTEANPSYVSITVRNSGGTVIGSTLISSGLQPSTSRTDQVALLSAPLAATGAYDVLVTVVDTAGQSGSRTNSNAVIVDATVPTAAGVEQPANLSTVIDTAGNTVIAAYVSDLGGAGIDPASFQLLLDGSYRSPLVSAVTGTGYSVSFTASGLAAGSHSVTLSYADKVGNAGVDKTWTFTMVRDNTAPVVSAVTAPTTAAPITVAAGATIAVSYAYTEVNPAYISITVKSGATVIGSSVISSSLASGAGITRTDDIALVSSPTAATGVFDILVTVVDTAGQAGSLTSNASVVVDNTIPVFSATVQPVGGSTVFDVNGSTVIAAYISDLGGAGVDNSANSLKLLVDGAYKNGAVITANGTGYTISFTASGGNALANGQHSVTVFGMDKVGNVAVQKNWSFTMVRDSIAPVIQAILSPTAGVATAAYTHASGTVDVTWSYVEANPSWVSITVKSGGTIVGQTVISSGLASAPTAITLTTSVDLLDTVAEGSYDVQVTMQDIAIHAVQQGTLTSAGSVVVDNTAPTSTVVAPAGASITKTAAPFLSANFGDLGGSGIALGTVRMRLDGSLVAATVSATNVQFTASGLADGPHTVDVDLNDKSNNPAQRLSWSFRTDTSAPSVAITAPSEGAYVRGTIPVDALSSDAGSGVTRTAFYHGGTNTVGTVSFFNGTGWNDGTGVSPSASTQWDTTGLPDGIYVLSAKAVDLVGNTGTSSNRMVTVDNTPPNIVINPVFSPTQYQAQTITGSLTEKNFSQLTVNGILATMTGTAPNFTWKAVVPLISGANGVTVTATDLAGNSNSVVTGITYDPTATAHIISPLAPGDYKGQIEIEATAPSATRWMTFQISPDNTNWYSVSLNASVLNTATTLTKTVTNGWRLSWDSIADGLADSNTYYLRNAAYDEFNQVLGTAVIGPFKVDNTAPVISYAIAPVPVMVSGNAEVYVDNIVFSGSIAETGSGMTRLRLEQYNSTGDHISDSPTDLPVLADNLFSHRSILVTGYNRLVLTAFDAAGNSSTTSTIVYYVPPQNSGAICAVGGTITAPDGTQVIVPNGALSSCINISLVTVPQSLMAAPADSYLKIVGVGHQIAPYSVVFQAQAQIVLPYNSADLDLDANGIPDYPATSLKVLFWDGSLWQNVGVDNIDTTNRLVTVRTNHLGLFALAADTAPTPQEAKVYLTKNPFRFGTSSPTSFVYEMPKPGKVTIRIYDITGDEVRTLVKDLPQSVGRFTQVWSGLNNFDRFVGTGAYFFKFDVEFADGSKTSVTKAIGVLK